MLNEKLTIRAWLKKFNNGEFDSLDRSIQCDAGWYDWFCNDKDLAKKTKSLGNKLKAIAGSTKINIDTSYVFFKNNCPMNGNLYDSFSICNIETKDVIFCITPKSGHKVDLGKANLWSKENDFQTPILDNCTWKDIKNWFLNVA